MPLNRTIPCVAIGLLISSFWVRPSFGQDSVESPLAPLFGPADVSTYGGDPQPNEGYFVQFDALYWSISAPSIKTIGLNTSRNVFYGNQPPGAGQNVVERSETSTLDTSGFREEFTVGQRIELGRMENGNGFMVGIYQQRDQDQEIYHDSASIVFNDPNNQLKGWVLNTPLGAAIILPLPVDLQNVDVRNTIDTWGVEVNYIHRFETSHFGSTLELFLGARYYEFNDNFDVYCGSGSVTPTGWANYMAGSYWETSVENHIVGPQVGVRWRKTRGRWTFNTEGRFVAGYNNQIFYQRAGIGESIQTGALYNPSDAAASVSTHSANENAFSPMTELRAEIEYKITSAISLRAGWTGMWVGNVARASNTVEYNWPTMGIDTSNCNENVFVTGVTAGVQINR